MGLPTPQILRAVDTPQSLAEALALGVDVVLVGRTTDPALVLGPLIHEFGWGPQDWERLAAGTLAGHLLECGGQVTGGTEPLLELHEEVEVEVDQAVERAVERARLRGGLAAARVGEAGEEDRLRDRVLEVLERGGVLLDPRFKPPRTSKPEIVVLCDVSGSMASTDTSSVWPGTSPYR